MCQPSKMSPDWVVKGCHIHVDGVELNIYPDHEGGIGFREVFSKTHPRRLSAAIRKAWEVCLPDGRVREEWLHKLDMARAYMDGYEGELAEKANGRMLEFKFLRIAIERWGAEHGNA